MVKFLVSPSCGRLCGAHPLASPSWPVYKHGRMVKPYIIGIIDVPNDVWLTDVLLRAETTCFMSARFDFHDAVPPIYSWLDLGPGNIVYPVSPFTTPASTE